MDHDQVFSSQSCDEFNFIQARNDVLNAFAKVEISICRILHAHGKLKENEPFSSKLKTFAGLDAGPLVAKVNKGQLAQLAAAISQCLPLRADIVHSEMRLVSVDAELVALFTNAFFAHDQDAPTRMLKLERIKRLSAKLSAFPSKIDALARAPNPPSSPPPPSPGAAGGP